MIEKNFIVDKLKSEGINENLGNSLAFESEEHLNSWVSEYKASLPEIKGLNDYTVEDLKKLADTGENKALQGLLDKVRTEAAKKAKATENPTPTPTLDNPTPADRPQWAVEQEKIITDLQKKLEGYQSEIEKNKQEKTAIDLIKKHKITDNEDINLVLLKLGGDFSEANIKKQSEAHVAYLTAKGIKHSPKASEGESMGALEKATKAFVEKKKKEKERSSVK
jgi:hypothetical protein